VRLSRLLFFSFFCDSEVQIKEEYSGETLSLNITGEWKKRKLTREDRGLDKEKRREGTLQ